MSLESLQKLNIFGGYLVPTIKTYKIAYVIKNVILKTYSKNFSFLNIQNNYEAIKLRRYWWYVLYWFTGVSLKYVGELTTNHSYHAIQRAFEILAMQYQVNEQVRVEIDELVYNVGLELEKKKIKYVKYTFAQPKLIMSKI